MPDKPQYSFFLSPSDKPVTTKSAIWKTALPLSRHHIDKPLKHDAGVSISHGDYFYAVRTFLEQRRFHVLTSAVSQHFNRDIQPDEIEEIQIFLEKHGEFYHPARIVAKADGTEFLFVVNVAVSRAGTELIQREHRLLKQLDSDFPNSFIPKVYDKGDVSINGSDLMLRLFLGEWFEGFNEFHISRDNIDEKRKLVVWDPVGGNRFLSAVQAKELYRQAAMILTYYYNIETFEQISHWHHAAGDFVVRLQDGKVELRLVTVRQYAPMFKEDEAEEQATVVEVMLEAMLIFFLNLTIRMRLDRLDGIGDMVWSDNISVEGTLSGFLQGLALKITDDLLPEAFVDYFRTYLSRCTESDLYDLSQSIVDQYNPRAPEIAVVKENLKAHAAVLSTAIHYI